MIEQGGGRAEFRILKNGKKSIILLHPLEIPPEELFLKKLNTWLVAKCYLGRFHEGIE